MVLDKHEKKYRQFLKAIKRLDKIEEELSNLPIILLDKPFQRGWEISIRLRDDIAKRADADSLNKLIELGYKNSYITQSLKEVKAIRRGEKTIPYTDWRGHKLLKSLIPDKRNINEKQYEQLTPNLQKYLDFDIILEAYQKFGRKVYQVYLPMYWICLKARPHIVTHQYLKGGKLEKEKAELEDFLKEYWREWASYRKDCWGRKEPATRSSVTSSIKKFLKGEKEDL